MDAPRFTMASERNFRYKFGRAQESTVVASRGIYKWVFPRKLSGEENAMSEAHIPPAALRNPESLDVNGIPFFIQPNSRYPQARIVPLFDHPRKRI